MAMEAVVDNKPLLGVTFRERSSSAFDLVAGYHEMQGVRPSMEDRHVLLPAPRFNKECKLSDNTSRSFFAVFDGHGGHVCAEYSKRNLHKNFVASDHFFRDSTLALRQACTTTDDKFIKAAQDLNLNSSSGTCAIIAYIEDSHLAVANIGDSRAVLCCKGRAVDMSEDHKPNRKDERRRIVAGGGAVARSESDAFNSNPCCVDLSYCLCPCLYSGPYRLYPGGLAVSRSIGDLSMKVDGLVISEPDIEERKLTEADEFLILACDGVWDVLSSQQAVDVVRESLAAQKNPTQAARDLTETAYHRGSTDNISAIVVTFTPPKKS